MHIIGLLSPRMFWKASFRHSNSVTLTHIPHGKGISGSKSCSNSQNNTESRMGKAVFPVSVLLRLHLVLLRITLRTLGLLRARRWLACPCHFLAHSGRTISLSMAGGQGNVTCRHGRLRSWQPEGWGGGREWLWAKLLSQGDGKEMTTALHYAT